MKQVFFAAVATLLATPFQSCDKTRITTLEGRVIDEHTSKPVAGIRIYMNAVGKKSEAYQTETSDADGIVSYSITTEGRTGEVNLTTENAFFYGYFERHYSETNLLQLKYGEENMADIPIEPKDAWLRMHMKNESNSDGNIYGYITGPSYWKHKNGDYFDINPLIVKQGDSTIYIMKVGSEQNVQVKLYAKSDGPIPAIPTGIIFCPRMDTTDIFLKL